jgi:hypothetical protein
MAPKPGLLTTEFWMHGILQVILLLNTIGVWNYMPPKYTVLVQGILGAFYAFSRGLAKINASGTPPPAPVYPVEPPGDTTEAAAA